MSNLRGGEDEHLTDLDYDCQALAEMAIPGYQGLVKEVDECLSDPDLEYQA
jgi:hypothetical protein